MGVQRFLLIGAGGLIGRHIRHELATRNVVATYRHDAPQGGVELDITDHDAARRIVRDSAPDVVILAAADAFVERCEREPVATRRINVDASAVVAEAARDTGARLVVFSSEYVFDGGAGPYAEDGARRPINEYGRQKVALEDIALATGAGLVCRTSAVFGEDPNRKNFVCQLVDSLRAGRHFTVPSDQFVTPTYAPSLAKAILRLLDGGTVGVFHIAGPDVLSRFDFARAAAEAFRLPIDLLQPRPTSALGLSAPRPLSCGLKTDRLRAALGGPLLDAASGLREMAGY